MTNPSDSATHLLRLAIVLGTDEETGTVVGEAGTTTLPYAAVFPRPRTERVAPGHLVAITAGPDRPEVIVWRWFDAVVVEQSGPTVTLWEPNHGTVLARLRDPQRTSLPGSRAYLSAGLPGAEWWLAGPVVDRPEDAAVELDEVAAFFTTHGLWDRLT